MVGKVDDGMKSIPIPKCLTDLGVTSAMCCGVHTEEDALRMAEMFAERIKREDERHAQAKARLRQAHAEYRAGDSDVNQPSA